ncbi:MAG TPA: M28 family peptidase, partial [Chthonomonadales bacterium]|nr:M28 family peptidase [Chthonomonadales bacterium]
LCSVPGRADLPAPALQAAYRQFYSFISPSNLSTTVNTLSSFGSRVAGYPGDKAAADYVLRQFQNLGLQNVREDPFTVAVPYDEVEDGASHGAAAQLVSSPDRLIAASDGRRLPMYPLWPNLVRTPTLPAGGITAPLIYVGDGKLGNFNGKNVDGSVVMVDFNCAAEWMNAPRLGAKAVIFVAPRSSMRGEGEAKFISIPIAIPRFWMNVQDAAPLLAKCVSGRPPLVHLTCRMPWRTEQAQNITGWIPGTDPHLRGQVIVVQAYYDSISVVPALAPGAETSCGMAAMLEMIRTFKRYPPRRSMMFVATSAHFQALQGIREYINQHMQEWTPPGWFEKKHPYKDIYLWCGLDLTSQTQSFGIFYKGWFYDFREDIQGRFSDIARVCRENADKVGNTIGFNSKRFFNDGVNPVDGKDWRNFIPGKPAFDSEAVTMAGGNGVTFASTDDSRALVDTPFDTPDKVNIANLARQVKLLTCLMWHIVTDTNAPGDINAQRMPITDPSKWSRMALQGGFATVEGRVQMFNPRKSFIAYSDPRLANSLVVIRNRTKSFMGVRGNMIQPVGANVTSPDRQGQNFFEFHGVAPLTAFGTNKPTTLAAYHLDHDGEIDYAPDLGPSGAKWIPLDVMITTAVEETPIIVFRCVPTAIYDLVDQQSLRALSGIDLYDGETNGEPRMYGYAIDPQDPTMVGSYVEDVAVLFAQPASRLKIAMNSGPGATRLLLLNSIYDPAHPFSSKNQAEGIGYLVAGDVSQMQNADLMQLAAVKYDPRIEIARSGAIYDTALHVAEDMWKLDDFRMRRLAKYR